MEGGRFLPLLPCCLALSLRRSAQMFAAFGEAVDEVLREAASGAPDTPMQATPAATQGEEEVDTETLFLFSLFVVATFYLARGVFLLALLATLAVLYLTNPAQTPHGRQGAWKPLLALRQTLVAKDAEAKASAGAWSAALRATFVDGLARGALGRRVFVDFKIGAIAYSRSSASVDQAVVSVGCLGEWTAVVSPTLRALASSCSGIPD